MLTAYPLKVEETMKTKVFVEQFKGHPVFAIWEVDDAGNKLEPNKGPYMSFGAKKAYVLFNKHIADLEKFVADNQAQIATTNPTIDMSKLSAEEQEALAKLLNKAK